MTDVQVIQPHELNQQHFNFNTATNTWDILIPTVSNSDQNALLVGSDGGAFLDKSTLKRYHIVPDPLTNSLNFYEYSGDSFTVENSVLVTSVDLATISIEVDDVAIAGSVLTFKDVQTDQTLTFDTALPMYEVFYQASSAISVTGNGKDVALTLDIIVNPDSDNLLTVTAEGVMVDASKVVSTLNTYISETLKAEHQADQGQLIFKVGETEKAIPTSRLVNSAGEVIGFIIST
ncbi:hypothetical protein [Acinetobacter sp. 272263]|uniref:hypothetical protein n=1 Tax=Acinetobacter sp. 272263 TaxID=1310639 RepID=UPI00044FD97D|nr:hypothetical protein [Acinetobacter sp. 272263]EXB84783.1 hypothetical protein J538_1859 [Acinetobacter sp. 272263]